MEELKVGDVVRLKSGGPAMTVTTVADNYGVMTAWCSWFDPKGGQSSHFPVGALNKEDE